METDARRRLQAANLGLADICSAEATRPKGSMTQQCEKCLTLTRFTTAGCVFDEQDFACKAGGTAVKPVTVAANCPAKNKNKNELKPERSPKLPLNWQKVITHCGTGCENSCKRTAEQISRLGGRNCRMSLSSTKVTAIPAGTFDRLTQLKYLYLYENEITELPAGVFRGLTQVDTIEMEYNKITVLSAGAFAHLPQLHTLDLGPNRLPALPAGVFDHLTQLQNLRLVGNRITALPAGVFDHLTQLRKLTLIAGGGRSWEREPGITELPAGVFDHLTQLQLLDLATNQITSLAAGVFDHLTQLQTLDLRENRITTLPAGVFDPLTQLQSLRLFTNSPFDSMSKVENPLECRVQIPTLVGTIHWGNDPRGRPLSLEPCPGELSLRSGCGSIKGGRVCNNEPNCEWKKRTCVDFEAPPTAIPTAVPTATPTVIPTAVPTATPTAAPTKSSASHCGSLRGKRCKNDSNCKWKHKTKTCVAAPPNTCICSNGSLGAPSSCPANGQQNCETCEAGWTLSGKTCEANTCTCSNGRLGAQSSCTGNGQQNCNACEVAYVLSGKICKESDWLTVSGDKFYLNLNPETNWSEYYPARTTWSKVRLAAPPRCGDSTVTIDLTDFTFSTSRGGSENHHGVDKVEWGVATDCRSGDTPGFSDYSLDLSDTPFQLRKWGTALGPGGWKPWGSASCSEDMKRCSGSCGGECGWCGFGHAGTYLDERQFGTRDTAVLTVEEPGFDESVCDVEDEMSEYMGCYVENSGPYARQSSPQLCTSIDECQCPSRFPYIGYTNGKHFLKAAEWSCFAELPPTKTTGCIMKSDWIGPFKRWEDWHVGARGGKSSIYRNPAYTPAEVPCDVHTRTDPNRCTRAGCIWFEADKTCL